MYPQKMFVIVERLYPVILAKSSYEEDMFVHREATSKYKKDRLKIDPNPDSSKNTPMYLKRPTKLPVNLFKPHNKTMPIPDDLVEQYSKNNK